MKVAVFGGSFDPVHCGHVAVADAVQAALRPDLLLWIPARHAPHKPGRPPADDAGRLALLQRVVDARSGEEVDTSELGRPGPSYTVETLRVLGDRYPGAEWVLIMGADSLSHLLTWRALPEVLRRARVALVPRTGTSEDDLESFRRALPAEVADEFRASFLPMENVDVSSTEIRARLADGRSCARLLPPAVEDEIRRRGMYASLG